MLEVNIKKHLGVFELDVSFCFSGGILALLGASGCGKSMTLKCIAGIEKPDSGRIALDGRVLFDSDKHIDLSPQERRVGYLFQQYALFPNMTVRQNIAAGLPKSRRNDAESAISEKISMLRLNGLENKRPRELSGGEQQRTALARILINEPELLLLDEPFSALDSYLKWQLEIELSDLLRKYGKPAVFVSHSRDEVYRLCDEVSVLTNGRSEEKIAVKELFESPRTLSACLLSGCKNYSAAKPLGGRRVFASDWGVELTAQRDIEAGDEYIGLRSHYISIVDNPGENAFECSVERVIDDVFSSVIMVKSPGGGLLRLEMGKSEWEKHKNNKKLCIFAAPCDIMVLKK